jgi:type I pantothenate kinase
VSDRSAAGPAHGLTPFIEIGRDEWAALAAGTPQPLTDVELVRLRGLGEPLDSREVSEVYLPLSRLLNLYATGARQLHDRTRGFLQSSTDTTPFVIGVAGSVAVGKSTVARLLRELLARWDDTPKVELVPTDGFLLPNAELERRGILARKGFPESYDRRALLRFVTAVKSGAAEVRAPFYSHEAYDIVPGAEVVVHRPDILILEGLNVLQPPLRTGLAVSDLFDFSVYVDARTSDIEEWYVERFRRLQTAAFSSPRSYFHRYASLGPEAARATASTIWHEINEPNLRENVLPTRSRARLVLRKSQDHAVHSVLLRKI